LGVKEAAQWINDRFAEIGKTIDNSPKDSSRGDRAGFDATKYAASLDPAHPSPEALGVPPETLSKWSVGYAKSGVLRGCLALPATRDGKIIACFGRNADGRLTFVNGFNSQDFIFGEDKGEGGALQLVRDPLDVIKAREAGVNAVCLLRGQSRRSSWKC
jgi:hypothetical protein